MVAHPESYDFDVLCRPAFAKLNLSLCVGPPEHAGSAKAGFHPIVSWMHAIELADEVRLSHRERGSSVYSVQWAADAPRTTPIDWPIEKDLAVRAHRLMERTVGRPLPVDLQVFKRIPVGGGLGGGSSDAAATLLGLVELFNLNMDDDALRTLAMTLGSDIAFFCDQGATGAAPRPAVVTGFGEVLRRVRPSTRDAVLVVPSFGCETRAVYQAFDRNIVRENQAARLRADETAHQGVPEILDDVARRNDLAAAACTVAPALAQVCSAVALGVGGVGAASVAVSGSGSTVFALASPGSGPAVATRLRAMPQLNDCQIVATRLVG